MPNKAWVHNGNLFIRGPQVIVVQVLKTIIHVTIYNKHQFRDLSNHIAILYQKQQMYRS